jgi:hypothetical protein
MPNPVAEKRAARAEEKRAIEHHHARAAESAGLHRPIDPLPNGPAQRERQPELERDAVVVPNLDSSPRIAEVIPWLLISSC